MKLNWNFLAKGEGVQNKTPSIGGVWIFSGTAQFCPPLFVLTALGSVFGGKKAKILSQQEKQRNICG